MSLLTVYADTSLDTADTCHDRHSISEQLGAIGVRFEHWGTPAELAADADQESVLDAYRAEIETLNRQYGFQSIDVVSLTPDNPKKEELRHKFLAEHTHADFEVRFFVDGSGLFYLHANNKVYCVLCERGDLISVPENTTHWFDMGSEPFFKCIRFFVVPDGWTGEFTGSDIATHFPDYDTFIAQQAR